MAIDSLQMKARLDFVNEQCKRYGPTSPVQMHLQPDQAALWQCVVRLNNVCAELAAQNALLERQVEALSGIHP